MQLVHVCLNLIVGEAARLQLHIGPLELSPRLTSQQILRQIPGCRDGELSGDLLPRSSLLEELELPPHPPAALGVQLGFVLEPADAIEELARQLGQLAPL